MATHRTLSDRLLDRMIERIEALNEIGVALSAERDPVRLQERILGGAMGITASDGGTIYALDEAGDRLEFVMMRTDSLGIARGGVGQEPVGLPPVPLHRSDGTPNHDSVVAHAVLENRTVHIADAYAEPGFDFSGTRAFDAETGYRSRSMLTIPMRDHENSITGVLQLLNAQALDGGTVIPYSDLSQRLAESLASQAAIALNRHRLIGDMQDLFEGFVSLIAEAIDQKSPYTGGHCRRVPIITMLLAEAASRAEEGPLAGWRLDEDERYQLHIAALLHDCGKITTPEWVMDKATKLHGIRDRIHELDLRFALLEREAEIERLRAELRGDCDERREAAYREERRALAEERDLLRRINLAREPLTAADGERVRAIARRRWRDGDGVERPLLDEEEVEHLTIPRGTLTAGERKIIEDHIVATIAMLESLPFPRHLRRVPEIAGGHHERVDGSGYPRGLTGDQMSVEARIMAIADVFEALTAADRPYKDPLKLSQALAILGRMKCDGHIDPDLFDVFVASGAWRTYAEEHLRPEQIDEVDLERIPGYTPPGTRTIARQAPAED